MPTCANLRRVAQARQRGVAWRRFLKGFDAVLGSRGVSHRSSLSFGWSEKIEAGKKKGAIA